MKFNLAQKIRAAVGVGAVVAAPLTFAASTAPDFSSLTAAIDWSSVVTGVLAAATAAVVVYIAVKGAKWVLGAIRAM